MPGRDCYMLTASESDFQLEIGHVLLIDIVGYSKLLITEQREQLQALNEIVRNTAQFQASDADGVLVRIPTGDGMALIFRDTVEAPLRCAVEISQAIKTHPGINLRMGIHSGPVSEVTDVSERTNIAAFVFLLRRPTRSALAIAGKSIAVLPFENLSEEKGNAYFAEGIKDEILTKLATVHDLKVISRTSTAKYQSKPDNLNAVAQELGVSTVLDGAVEKTGR